MSRIDGYDLVALIGLLLLAVGCWLVYEPLALIVPGLLLLAFGVIGGVIKGRSE